MSNRYLDNGREYSILNCTNLTIMLSYIDYMDIIMARSLGQKLHISMDYVVREEYEILLLKEIFESEFGSALVFKGGTALRLAYNSPRFSEDLDFTLITDIDPKKFNGFLKDLANTYPTITHVETHEKYYTIFALVRVKEDYLDRAFSIKVEISKREGKWVKEKDYTNKLIVSKVTPLTTLIQVATVEKILEEKKDAMKNRKVARDVFDFWYINQLLKQTVKITFEGYDKKEVKAELHRLLPRHFWKVVDTWVE